MRTLIIDSHQLCYSSAYTLSGLSSEEMSTGVIFGFLLQIFRLAYDFDTKDFIFCWDSKKRKRQITYPEYKNDRKNSLDEETIHQVRLQMGYLRDRVLPDLGFKNNFIKTGFEADDLIACVLKKMPGCTVVSNDSDLYQLLDFCEMYDIHDKSRYYLTDFVNQYGITPLEWIDALAISGTHNNVKGIEGAGIIKAIQYLKDQLSDGKIKDRIESIEGKGIIKRNVGLIKLPLENIDLDIDLPDSFDLDNWLDIFNRYDFRSFISEKGMQTLRDTFFKER